MCLAPRQNGIDEMISEKTGIYFVDCSLIRTFANIMSYIYGRNV